MINDKLITTIIITILNDHYKYIIKSLLLLLTIQTIKTIINHD